jgi:nucleotide-binding universal stress UspA family protein
VIVHGREYEQSIEQARKDQCDLIVLGRHRPSSALQDILGTTVDRVLRLGGIPVLAVRRKAEQPYTSILVAVDFSSASRRALEHAVRWFPDARIEAITAYRSPRRSLLVGADASRQPVDETQRLALKGFLAEVAQALGPDYATAVGSIVPAVEHGWPEDVILRAVEETKPDLVVIGTHARGGIGHALLGSVAEWVLMEAPPRRPGGAAGAVGMCPSTSRTEVRLS